MTEESTQLSGFFEVGEFDLPTYEQYADLVYASAKDRERFDTLVNAYRERVEAGEGKRLTLAIGLTILNRFAEAVSVFAQAGRSAARYYFGAIAEMGLGRHADAAKHFAAAAEAGWDAFDCDMQAALAHLRAGDLAAAEALAEKHKSRGSDRADWYLVAGEIAERHDDRLGAMEHYKKALALDENHCGAMFRAAWLCDIAGDDEQAIELYERLANRPRAHVNALVNLAVVYEDRGDYDQAASALRRVLSVFPNHARARLFLKDVESSREMVIDETLQQRAESRNRLIETPIGEFELSVRARNCLKKMNIRTLGDLLQLTEAELLSYKNFGETSLNEIRALLARRGLKLGQRPETIDLALMPEPAPAAPKVNVPAGSEAALLKPVSELELSVRARRCLQRLGITTVGDLIQHTEAELLAARNFGTTSLTEIKNRLSQLGLQLAPKG